VRAHRQQHRQSLTVPSSNGVTLAVHDLSPDAPDGAEPLLLAHATGFHGYVWQPLATHLHGFRALAPDLRGHGDSSVPDHGDFAWDGFADDVLAVVDRLELAGASAVGHSKGGAALLLAEQRRPGTFRSLYLYEPVVFPPMDARPEDHGGNRLAEGARRRRPGFPSRDAAYENFAGKPPLAALEPSALRAYVDHGFEDLPDGSVRLKCEPENESEVYRMGAQHGAFGQLHSIGCPVTVARGAISDAGPASVAEEIVRALPDGRLEVFDHLGHFGPLERPAEIAAAVERFLAAT
jgi:pimeloyl-ACP methyl ester carboxylesterase